MVNLDDPVTMDLGPLADIPVILDNVGLSPLSLIVPAKKRKRRENIVVTNVRKSRRLLNKNK